MNPVRGQRMVVALFLLAGVGVTAALVMLALEESINLFYEPAKVVGGEAPRGVAIRAGGMVVDGSVTHDAEGLGVSFALTDYRGHTFDVYYEGLLPGLFREGQGILVHGRLDEAGLFHADQVNAKHDENYMPPELEGMASHPGGEGSDAKHSGPDKAENTGDAREAW